MNKHTYTITGRLEAIEEKARGNYIFRNITVDGNYIHLTVGASADIERREISIGDYVTVECINKNFEGVEKVCGIGVKRGLPIEADLHLETLSREYFDKHERDREEFARNWLLACGWDGEDIEKARRLAEGYAIVDLPGGGFVIERVRSIVETLKAGEKLLEEKE